jgi:hypothetical protein
MVLSAVIWAGFGGLIGTGVESSISRRRDPRIAQHERYLQDLRAYQEWERRTREQFWLELSGHRFEKELARVFRYHGYEARVTPGSGDKGVDIILQRAGRTTLVQCKRNRNPVGPAVARELYGTLRHMNADDAILAVVGGVTPGVHEFFSGKPMRVMGLDEIVRLQRQITTPTARNTQ